MNEDQIDQRRKDIGAYLKRVREERDLTQTELASRMNTDRWHIQDLEYGKTNYTVNTLLIWLDALRLTFRVRSQDEGDSNNEYLGME